MPGVREEMSLGELSVWASHTADELASLDFTEPLQQCSVLLAASSKECFDGSHDPDGVPWAPIQPRQGRGGSVPLRNNGILMASVTGEGQGHVQDITTHSLDWGTNISYAAIHNYGGIIHIPAQSRATPWVFTGSDGRTVFTRTIGAHDVVIPQRQFVGIGEETAGDIEDVFGTFIERKVA